MLFDGTRVVVKVQRPGIDEVVARDAAVLRLAARRLERHMAQDVGLNAFSEELIAGLNEELDYLHEAAMGMKLRENRARDVGIAMPKVYSTLSTDRVLVMEEVVARSVADSRLWTQRRGAPARAPAPVPRFSARCSTTGCFTRTPTPAIC